MIQAGVGKLASRPPNERTATAKNNVRNYMAHIHQYSTQSQVCGHGLEHQNCKENGQQPFTALSKWRCIVPLDLRPPVLGLSVSKICIHRDDR